MSGSDTIDALDAASAGPPPPPRRVRRLARWMSRFYFLSALVLVPWIVYLAVTLPRRSTAGHYRLAWVGFDIGLTVALGWTAWLARKVDARVVLPAVATGTMLILDAWFDITTANGSEALLGAVASAVFIELPMAAVSIWLARRAMNGVISRLAHPVPLDAAEVGCLPEAPLTGQVGTAPAR